MVRCTGPGRSGRRGLAIPAGLLGSPAATGEARSAWSRQPFDGHQPTAGLHDPPGLSQACVQVGPMMHGGDGPNGPI